MGWINLARTSGEQCFFFGENSELDVGSIVVREFFVYLKTISFSKNASEVKYGWQCNNGCELQTYNKLS